MGFFGSAITVIGIIIDFLLTAAIVYAYFPQLQSIRKATNGVPPSVKGISPYYLLSHALFTGFLLSNLLILGDLDKNGDSILNFGSLSTFSFNVALLQLTTLWLCSVSMIVLYVIGYQKSKSHGKIVLPLLVALHAFVFLVVGLDVGMSPNTISGAMLGGLLGMIGVAAAPALIPFQAYVQYAELREADDLGAFSLRSFTLQTAVMGAMAVRGIVRIGVPVVEDWARRNVFAWVVAMFTTYFLPITYLAWAGAALYVYHVGKARHLWKNETEQTVFLE